ncbi:peptidylprolyl isomerase [Marinimicrobium sp. C2-29]|uniref:peptidylprolyl isomerase n=1 Tax=Marinimicrobium sp. C2-29 TaxID=3139825 RepID=UPI00313872B3
MLKQTFSACTFATLLFASHTALATTVQFQTVMGDFEVNLYDETTPETVANFLAYVEAGDYTQTFIHRSMPEFIIQGGGFAYDEQQEKAVEIDDRGSVVNEPVWSNRKGTIAMAKLGSDPNSATSEWFFNLKDNHANLDIQNGGFTVFGEVIGDGMEVVEAIAELPRFNLGGVYKNLPLRNYTADDAEAEEPVTPDHLVSITAIVVLDASPDTAADLDPVPNTLIDEAGKDADNSSSGSLSGWVLFLLASLGLTRLTRSRRV